MSYQTAVEDYLDKGYIAGEITTASVIVLDNNCDVVLTYSGCHSLDNVALAVAVGCCHELPATGTYTLSVKHPADAIRSTGYSYDWLGVSGTIERVVKF